ncbi:MAG: DUF1801 domain-containing protein [Planctomycetota bacterium]
MTTAKNKTSKATKDGKPASKPAAKRPPKPKVQPVADVDTFVAQFDGAAAEAIQTLRQVVHGAGARVVEGIKWNAPSFRTTEWFATMNLHPKQAPDTVRLVLHAGAKASPDLRAVIDDPDGLLEWLGKERAIVSFAGAADVKAKQRALQAVLKQWLQQLPKEEQA